MYFRNARGLYSSLLRCLDILFILLFLILQTVQLIIDATLRQKFVVCTRFTNLTFMHDNDRMRTLYGRKTMRYDDRGSSGEKPVYGLLNQKFGLRIDARCCLVENEDLGIEG